MIIYRYRKGKGITKMLHIEKSIDERYPFKIRDGWGGDVYATKDDLEKFLKELQKILDKK